MESRFAITIDSALCAGYGVCVLDTATGKVAA